MAENNQAPADMNEFFGVGNADTQDFIRMMQMPKEEIPEVVYEEPNPASPEIQTGTPPPGEGDTEEQMAEYMDFTADHRLTAEFLLVQLDKGFSFIASLISGLDSDRYRRRKEKPKGEDYEADLAAALVKKYQLKLSLEWMFVTALVMAYAPVMNEANKDRKKVLAARQQIIDKQLREKYAQPTIQNQP